MKILDEQIGRGIKSSGKNCRKFRDGQIPYSSVFANKLFWHGLIRKLKGIKVSNRRLRVLSRKIGILIIGIYQSKNVFFSSSKLIYYTRNLFPMPIQRENSFKNL